MRHLLSLLGLSVFLASPAFADPPGKGFVGTIAYENGKEPSRFACDRLDLVQTLYKTGQSNLFMMRPKFDELAHNAETGCPISRLLGAAAAITMDATLL